MYGPSSNILCMKNTNCIYLGLGSYQDNVCRQWVGIVLESSEAAAV